MVRGIEYRDIFADDTDKECFVASLSALLSKSATKCYAWALMSNHLHLLLMPTRVSLSETMRCLLTGYAVYFNRKYQRCGHLFQNRYKSMSYCLASGPWKDRKQQRCWRASRKIKIVR
jgi:REP element-mobilizing transposase RayT